jgi:O-antigen ligase
MGIALAMSLMSIAYERGRAYGLAWAGIAVGLLVGVLGLTSAQFIVKSEQLYGIINLLPRVTTFPGAEGGFNVNEIGGAMAFFAPFTAGFAIYQWRRRWLPGILVTTLTCLILMLALVLGQSRMAIIGVVVTLAVVIYLLAPAGRARMMTLAALVAFAALEVMIVTQAFATPATSEVIAERDETSLSQRPEIWNAALTLIRENPLTGYGLNQFRRREVRSEFVPDFAMVIIPHAHNELLQVGADLGIPGMIVYIGWHLTLAVMVWKAWRNGDLLVKTLAVSAAGGLAAHAIFGLADAITLFDRFTFAYWLLVGLAGSAYILTLRREAQPVMFAV